MLFPRAEKVLQEEGLRPEIVQELAPGKKVYVRKDDFLGKAHALFDSGPFFVPFRYRDGISDDNNIAAFTDSSISPFFENVCSVYMKSSSAKEVSFGFTPQDIQRLKLLHEIRHCSEENKNKEAGILREGDSDYNAIEAFAKNAGNQKLRESFLLHRSEQLRPNSHDTALYLDAQFRHAALFPSKSDMDVASSAFKSIVQKNKNISFNAECRDEKNIFSCSYEVDGMEVPFLVGRRFQLLQEAQETNKKASPKPAS